MLHVVKMFEIVLGDKRVLRYQMGYFKL